MDVVASQVEKAETSAESMRLYKQAIRRRVVANDEDVEGLDL